MPWALPVHHGATCFWTIGLSSGSFEESVTSGLPPCVTCIEGGSNVCEVGIVRLLVLAGENIGASVHQVVLGCFRWSTTTLTLTVETKDTIRWSSCCMDLVLYPCAFSRLRPKCWELLSATGDYIQGFACWTGNLDFIHLACAFGLWKICAMYFPYFLAMCEPLMNHNDQLLKQVSEVSTPWQLSITWCWSLHPKNMFEVFRFNSTRWFQTFLIWVNWRKYPRHSHISTAQMIVAGTCVMLVGLVWCGRILICCRQFFMNRVFACPNVFWMNMNEPDIYMIVYMIVFYVFDM